MDKKRFARLQAQDTLLKSQVSTAIAQRKRYLLENSKNVQKSKSVSNDFTPYNTLNELEKSWGVNLKRDTGKQILKDSGYNAYTTYEMPKKTSADIINKVQSGNLYDFRYLARNMADEIGFDTISTDINNLDTQVNNLFSQSNNMYTWQSQETIDNIIDSLQNMSTRLETYDKYKKMFDVENHLPEMPTEISSAISSSIEGAEALKKEFGIAKDAKEYKAIATEKNKLNELFSMSSKEIEPNLKKDNGIAYTTSDGYDILWKELYNDAKRNETISDVNKKYNVKNDGKYKKKPVKYSQRTTHGSFSSVSADLVGGTPYYVPDNEDNHIYNIINGDADAIDKEHLAIASGNGVPKFAEVEYEHLTNEEIQTFNTLWEKEGAKSAKNFLSLIMPELKKRRSETEKEEASKFAERSPGWSSLFTIASSFDANFSNLAGIAASKIMGEEINPNDSLYFARNFTDSVRGTVSNNIDNELGNFLYRHGMDFADNLVNRYFAKSIGGDYASAISQGLAGSRAFSETVLSAKERGLSDGEALSLGIVAGAAEAVFESEGFEALFGAKGLSKGGWKYFVGNLTTEIKGELATEVVNDIADYLIAQDASQLSVEFDSYIARGMSKEEASTEVLKNLMVKYADVAAGAGFSAGISATPGAISTNIRNKNIGATIKNNSTSQQMIDIASGKFDSNFSVKDGIDSLEISTDKNVNNAYEAYTKYAKKGINADNIKDAQLGSLYSMAFQESKSVLENKKSTPEQKAIARQRLEQLETIMTGNTTSKIENKAIKSVEDADEETIKAFVEEGLESGEDTKSYKLAKEIDAKIKNGENVTQEEVQQLFAANQEAIHEEGITKVKNIARVMPKEEAKVFEDVYAKNPNLDSEQYEAEYNLAVEQAKAGMPITAILEKTKNLTSEQVKDIYKNVISDEYQSRQNELTEEAKKAGASLTVPGVFNDSIIDRTNKSTDGVKVNWNNLTTSQRDAVKFLELFSAATGTNINLIKSKVVNGKHVGENGSYNKKTNTIDIDVFAGRINSKALNDSIVPTLSHEITHWTKNKAPALYDNLKNEVFKALKKITGKSMNDLIDLEIARLDQDHKGKKHTEAEAVDEIVAKAMEDMLSNSQKSREMLANLNKSERKTFVEKVKGVVKDILKWIDKTLNRYKSASEEAKALRAYKAEFEKLSKMWDETLEVAVQNNKVVENDGKFKHKTETKEDVLFCERSNSPNEFNPDGLTLREQLKQAFDESESKERRYVYVGEFTQSFVDKLKEHIIIKKFPIVMNYRDAYLSMKSKEDGKYRGEGINYHNLGVDGLESALKSFDNPEYVLLSKKEGKIELILEGRDYKNRQLFSIVEVNTNAQHNKEFLPVHVVNSVYGNRGLKNRIANAEAEGRIIYNKKEESTQGMPQVQYERDINANSSDDSILDFGKNVKEKFYNRDSMGRELSKGQQEYFKDSAVRDENGSLKVMYRGDSSEFTVFDKKKTKYANLYGRGFYFTDSKTHAEQYGGTREFYLDIKKPLSPGQNAITQEQMLNFLKAIENNGEDYDLYNYGQDATAQSVLESVWGKGDFEMLQDINASAIGDLVAAVELFNEVNGTIYDGIIVPTETVTFNSKQAKLTSNLNPTENDDIRYSDRKTSEYVDVYELMGERDRVNKENEKLKADIERLKELRKLDKTLTHGKMIKDSDVLNVATHFKKMYNSNMDKVELAKALKSVYSYIVESDNLTFDEVYERCLSVAEDIVKSQKPKETFESNEAKRLLREIKASRIRLNDTQKAEAKHVFGSNWNRLFYGKVIIANDGTSLDMKWQEWSEQYGDIFEEGLTDADQIVQLYYNIDALKEATQKIEEYDFEEDIRMLAYEIYDKYWSVSTLKTTADKHNKQIQLLKVKHKNAMTDLRESYKDKMNEKADRQKLVDDMFYKRKLLEKNKEKNEAVAKQKLADDIHFSNLINKLKIQKEQLVDKAKAIGEERLSRYKDNALKTSAIRGILSVEMSLNKKFKTNSKDIHIPEPLKPVVVNLLNAIDSSSKSFLEKGIVTKADMERERSMSKVRSIKTEESNAYTLKKSIQEALKLYRESKSVIDSTSEGGGGNGIVGLDATMIQDIEKMLDNLDALIEKGEKRFVLQEMSLENLATLGDMVKNINHWAITADKSLYNMHRERISKRATKTANELGELGVRQKRVDAIEGVKDFLLWKQALPANVFEYLGEEATNFYNDLLGAQGQSAKNQQEIMDFMGDFFKKYKKSEVNKWRRDVKTFEIVLPGTEEKKTVNMPVSFIMNLYCTAKQDDARRHMYGVDSIGGKLEKYKDKYGVEHEGGGITINKYKKGKFSTKVEENLDNMVINQSIVDQIVSTLTEQQKKAADDLQKFMGDKGKAWGNPVSMALYGVEKFNVDNYFPIKVSPNELTIDRIRDERTSLYSILNYGVTKERNPDASQSVQIDDIFTVFANHMHTMAMYNAYALSIYDTVRWLDYKGDGISVKKSIEKSFGEGALRYVTNLIKDINGQNIDAREGPASWLFKNAKVAMVSNSASTVLLQPTAYIRAMTELNPVNLTKASAVCFGLGKDSTSKKPNIVTPIFYRGIQRAKKYSGLALLKSQGYFETGISPNVSKKLLHNESAYEKVQEFTLKGAELADEFTWGVLWTACEFEVKNEIKKGKIKGVKVGSEDYFKKVGKKLDYVISTTQVVDSPLTKSDMMRSPSTKAKELTMFASELVVSYNNLVSAVYKTALDSRRYGKAVALKRNAGNIARVVVSHALTSAIIGAMTVVFSDIRFNDDEEKEEIKKKIQEAIENGDEEEYKKLIAELEELSFGSKFEDAFWAEMNPLRKLPIVRDLFSVKDGYDVTRTEALSFVSFFKAKEYSEKAEMYEQKMKEAKTLEGLENAKKWKEIYEEQEFNNYLKAASYVSGLGIYNFWRDSRAILRTIGAID